MHTHIYPQVQPGPGPRSGHHRAHGPDPARPPLQHNSCCYTITCIVNHKIHSIECFLFQLISLSLYIYIYICICVYIYIYM